MAPDHRGIQAATVWNSFSKGAIPYGAHTVTVRPRNMSYLVRCFEVFLLVFFGLKEPKIDREIDLKFQ